MTGTSCVLLLAMLLAGLATAAEPLALRVRETAETKKLEVRHDFFQHGETHLALLSTVHLADPAFFAQLQKELRTYDMVLYEDLGKPEPSTQTGQTRVRHPLIMLKGVLGLAAQSEALDYQAANFVHADFTASELKQHLENQPALKPSAPTLSEGPLAEALLAGDRPRLKKEVMKRLVKDNSSALSHSHFINERNAKCLRVLERERKTDHRRIAILFGAAHTPDLHQRLKDKGARHLRSEWQAAWTVPSPDQ